MEQEKLFDRIAELYKPYTSEREKLRELEKQSVYLRLAVKKIQEFCQMQADMNEELLKLMK